MRRILKRGLPLAVAFLVGAAMVGSAWAAVTKIKGNLVVTGTVKARNFQYSKPKTNRLVVPGAAFVGNMSLGYTGSAYIENSDAVAAVNLPHGAVVTRVEWYHQSGAAGEAELHLESNNRTGGHDDMVIGANVACTDTPCRTVFTSVSPNTINNNRRHYGVWLTDQGPPGFETFSVVIFYRTRAVGPASSSLPGSSWQGTPSREH